MTRLPRARERATRARATRARATRARARRRRQDVAQGPKGSGRRQRDRRARRWQAVHRGRSVGHGGLHEFHARVADGQEGALGGAARPPRPCRHGGVPPGRSRGDARPRRHAARMGPRGRRARAARSGADRAKTPSGITVCMFSDRLSGEAMHERHRARSRRPEALIAGDEAV